MAIESGQDAIPLYVGIPLALLCVSVSVFVIVVTVYLWQGARENEKAGNPEKRNEGKRK